MASLAGSRRAKQFGSQKVTKKGDILAGYNPRSYGQETLAAQQLPAGCEFGFGCVWLSWMREADFYGRYFHERKAGGHDCGRNHFFAESKPGKG